MSVGYRHRLINVIIIIIHVFLYSYMHICSHCCTPTETMVSTSSASLRSSAGRANSLLGPATKISRALQRVIGPTLQNTPQILEITLRENICGLGQMKTDCAVCVHMCVYFSKKDCVVKWIGGYVIINTKKLLISCTLCNMWKPLCGQLITGVTVVVSVCVCVCVCVVLAC